MKLKEVISRITCFGDCNGRKGHMLLAVLLTMVVLTACTNVDDNTAPVTDDKPYVSPAERVKIW